MVTDIRTGGRNDHPRQRLCLVDFDDTLITVDSLRHIMKSEYWLFAPSLLIAGVRLFLCMLCDELIKPVAYRSGKKADPHVAGSPIILRARSRFKYLMLTRYDRLSADKKKKYTEYLRDHINLKVLDMIRESEYDRIVIISASDEGLIRDVLSDSLAGTLIIANSTDNTDIRSFRTCYGIEKVSRLSQAIPDYRDHEITVFTDSYSDRPLMELADTVYLIKDNDVVQVNI